MPHEVKSMKKYKLHDAIQAEVSALLENEKKHITVLMPTGSGKSLLLGRIVKSLKLTTVVIVSRKLIQEQLFRRKEELFGTESVTILAMTDLQQNQFNISDCTANNPGLIVLLETTPIDRENIARSIPADATVLSFGSDYRIKDASFVDETVYPFECSVFYSESILDVRDIIVASDSERQSIINQIEDRKNKQNRLLFALRTAPFNASPNASQAELAILNAKIKERDQIIAEKEEQISILTSLLLSAGVSVDKIIKSVDYIREIKRKYADDDSESAIKTVSDAIAEQSQILFSPYLTPINKEYYSSFIQSKITEAVWKKLCKESQTCLITGKIAFQSMVNTNDDSLDYSGICILASKALDFEMAKRFFHNYMLYLRKNIEQSKWPYVLFDKNHELLTGDKFTLGSVRFVVGIDENGFIVNEYAYKMFLKYAKMDLYEDSFPRADIGNHLKKCIETIEFVRSKYRNPAAHRTQLNQVTAIECFDYLVDTYRKLKEILEVMR